MAATPAIATILLAGTALLSGSPASAVPSAAAQGQCGTDLSTNAAAPSISTDVTTLGSDQTATVTVMGSRYLTGLYQCGANKFGGVYLFFGWVQPGSNWGPSHRESTSMQGQFGTTYSYPGEGGGGDIRDDGSGIVRLVSFTDGGDSGEATDFHMDANGNWQANLVVRGATYSFFDVASGARSTVDCRQVQCGVYTIGAHGISGRTNELFVPITFTDAAGAPITPAGGAVAGAGGADGGAGSGSGVEAAAGSVGSGGTGVNGGAASASSTTVAPDVTTDTTAATSTTAAEDRKGDPEESGVLASQTAASVQDFDNSGGDGSTPILVLGAVALLVVIASGVVFLRRSRRTGSVAAVAVATRSSPAEAAPVETDGTVGTPR